MTSHKPALARYPTAARGVMRFHLVYQGQLPSAGNKAKPDDVLRIRRELSPQLKFLWETHQALQVLKHDGATERHTPVMQMKSVNDPGFIAFVDSGQASRRGMAARYPDEWDDLLEPISVGNKRYSPLVRESLSLNCELEILFLRQQDPGQLISQGGDIDGRMKTLLDALRIPHKDEQDRNTPDEDELWCLMESDTLVSDLSIETDRLLFPQSTHPHEVHLTIAVRLNVLRVGNHNVCLL